VPIPRDCPFPPAFAAAFSPLFAFLSLLFASRFWSAVARFAYLSHSFYQLSLIPPKWPPSTTTSSTHSAPSAPASTNWQATSTALYKPTSRPARLHLASPLCRPSPFSQTQFTQPRSAHRLTSTSSFPRPSSTRPWKKRPPFMSMSPRQPPSTPPRSSTP